MTSLSKAEQFLKESRNFAKFRSLKKKIGLAEEPKKIFSKSILSKKTLGKRLQNPMRIPRAGFNIDCLYKYGL